MKVAIIGTNHAGIAAANTLLNHYDVELEMFDKSSRLAYLSCGSALWVGRQITDYEGLFYTHADDFRERGAKVHMETEVYAVDFDKKIVYARSKDGEEFESSYDKLILATGSLPIAPPIPGMDLKGLHYLKSFSDGTDVDEDLNNEAVERIAVIGAGYIGVEIAEAAKRRGKEVLLFDAADTSLSTYYDRDFAVLMDENIESLGIETHFGELVEEYKGDSNGRVNTIVSAKGEYPVDMVVNCIGFQPNVEFGKDHLELFTNGAYLVDRHQRTSDQNVYAIGDCATIYSNALDEMTYIALASNAVRSGIIAGKNVGGDAVEAVGVQGSNAIHIGDFMLTSTGLTVKDAEEHGLKVDYVDYEDEQYPSFMPHNDLVKLRIVWEEGSRRILGAQLASRHDVSLLIHMFSLAIQEHLTIDKLAQLDI